MYDYSGNWSCTVGLPAKSGVAGAVCVVIPSVMGLCIFSPRLDQRGNSVRGVDFCKKASSKFEWSLFDQLVPNPPNSEEEDDSTNQSKPTQDAKRKRTSFLTASSPQNSLLKKQKQ